MYDRNRKWYIPLIGYTDIKDLRRYIRVIPIGVTAALRVAILIVLLVTEAAGGSEIIGVRKLVIKQVPHSAVWDAVAGVSVKNFVRQVTTRICGIVRLALVWPVLAALFWSAGLHVR